MNETAFRSILLAVIVVQSVLSLIYIIKARGVGSVFRRREEGLPLTVLIVVFYSAYCGGIVAYLLEPHWMAWGSVSNLPVWARWMGITTLILGAILVVWGLGGSTPTSPSVSLPKRGAGWSQRVPTAGCGIRCTRHSSSNRWESV